MITESATPSTTLDSSLTQLLSSYPAPVNQLIPFDEPTHFNQAWPDYPNSFGLNSAHIPDLCRMATDPRFDTKGPDWPNDNPHWAPIHAIRALGQLDALEAAPVLLPLLKSEDDWVMSDLPTTLAMLGSTLIPELGNIFKNTQSSDYERSSVAETLDKMVERHPETRTACLKLILDEFQSYRDNTIDWNNVLLMSLVNMKAEEAAKLIQEAFQANCVTDDMCGNWLQVKAELGLTLTQEEQNDLRAQEAARLRRIAILDRIDHQLDAETTNQKLTVKKKSKAEG